MSSNMISEMIFHILTISSNWFFLNHFEQLVDQPTVSSEPATSAECI